MGTQRDYIISIFKFKKISITITTNYQTKRDRKKPVPALAIRKETLGIECSICLIRNASQPYKIQA
jgi:hypothetical protein